MRFLHSYHAYFISFIGAIFISCAPNSAYKGGSGSFVSYEGLSDYKLETNKGNYNNQTFNSSKKGFSSSLVEPDAYALGSYGGSSYMPPSDTSNLSGDDSLLGGMRDSAAIQRATMRPYKVGGKMYYPTKVKVGDTFDGIASWYGPTFHAKATSNGEKYNMYAHTAASKTLPMNTIVKVFNKDNSKSTVVRINDRGPFVEGRIIDLSNVAGRDIDMVGKGTANVRIEIIGFGSQIAKQKENTLTPSQKSKLDSNIKMGGSSSISSTQVQGSFIIQLSSFSKKDGALFFQEQTKHQLKNSNYDVKISKTDNGIYRVFVEGFKSEGEANDFKNEQGLSGVVLAK